MARHRRKTIAAILLALALTLAAGTELFLSRRMGLGNPVIYDSYPLYGFRPLPNPSYRRFHGARLHFNNLALRAEEDSDSNPGHKVLFHDSVHLSRAGHEMWARMIRKALEMITSHG